MEEWKDVKGYEGLYQVSNLGRVKSLGRWVDYISKNGKPFKRWSEEIITHGSNDCDGYKRVTLRKNKIKDCWKVHILVATAFIQNPENKPDVHHIDHNPTNNNVNNLMWVTRPEHAKLHSERYEKSATAAKNACSKPVVQYTMDGQFLKDYPSIKEAGRQTSLDDSNICACCKGKLKTAGGFVWKYA